uniref:Myelin P2 protein n=1 Tax=Ceratitis capitata TaxID=7213 RepID=W8B1V7_CERCA
MPKLNKINCWLGKQYKLDCSDNYDAYMKELGMGLVQRKLGNTQKPIVMLHQVGSTHNLLTINDDKPPHILTFKLGKEFEEETYDLRKMCTVMNLYDNTLVQEQKGVACRKVVITREFHLTKMIEQSVINNVAAVRVFRVIDEDERKDLNEVLQKLEKEQRPKDGENDKKKGAHEVNVVQLVDNLNI